MAKTREVTLREYSAGPDWIRALKVSVLYVTHPRSAALGSRKEMFRSAYLVRCRVKLRLLSMYRVFALVQTNDLRLVFTV